MLDIANLPTIDAIASVLNPGPSFGIQERMANVTVNVEGGIATSAEIGESVVNALRAYSRSAGPLDLPIVGFR
jgi:succinyl-CoA synthetase beta subunit